MNKDNLFQPRVGVKIDRIEGGGVIAIRETENLDPILDGEDSMSIQNANLQL